MIPGAMLLVLASPALQDTSEAALRLKLQDLSALVRRIESEESTRNQTRTSEKRDRLILSIRDLMHLDPALAPRFLEYVRSDREPESARAVAVLALGQPARQDLILLLASLLEDPPGERIAQCVFSGFRTFRDREPAEAWAWELLAGLHPSDEIMFSPHRGRVRIGFSFGNPSPGVSYLPLLRSMLALLESDRYPGLRSRIQMVEQIIRDVRVQGADRKRFERLVEKVYLEGKEGWRTALDLLLNGRALGGAEPLEIIGAGLARFTTSQKSQVLAEVIHFPGPTILRPPFVDCLEEVVAFIGEGQSGGTPSAHTTILGYLISLNEAWAEKLLIKSESVRIRRLCSALVHESCAHGDRFEVIRHSKCLERMIQDPDGIVQGNARAALRKALERKPAVFDEERADELRRLLGIRKP